MNFADNVRRLAITLVTGMTLAGLLAGCATNPATGREEFTVVSQDQERQIGAENHPRIIKQFGGIYDDDGIGGYAAQIGGRLAANSELPGLDFHFTVLNSPTVNAFALPGGYVYVTRGLLAYANSEAELAGVIGHEIGHVTARHGAQRQTNSALATIFALGLGIATGSGEVAQLGQALGQGVVANYSRQQELEADDLGVRYLTRSGYDPYAQADFLATLQAQAELSARIAGKDDYDPNRVDFFASHPATAQRFIQAINAARASGVPVGNGQRFRDRYLDTINGMLYGDDPKEGFVRNREFLHPVLRFGFQVPRGFRLSNRSDAVYAQGPSNSIIKLDSAATARGVSTLDYLRYEWAKDVRLEGVEPITINGMQAATGFLYRNGNNGQTYLRLIAIRFSDDLVYRFIMAAPQSALDRVLPDLQRISFSFRKLTNREASSLKPQRIKVVRVGRRDTVASLAARLPFEDFKEERFRLLNGLKPTDRLTPGTRVKLIVE